MASPQGPPPQKIVCCSPRGIARGLGLQLRGLRRQDVVDFVIAHGLLRVAGGAVQAPGVVAAGPVIRDVGVREVEGDLAPLLANAALDPLLEVPPAGPLGLRPMGVAAGEVPPLILTGLLAARAILGGGRVWGGQFRMSGRLLGPKA